MPRRAGCRRLHRAPPRQEVEAGQHIRRAQRRHHLAWLWRRALLRQLWLLGLICPIRPIRLIGLRLLVAPAPSAERRAPIFILLIAICPIGAVRPAAPPPPLHHTQ